MPPSSEKIGRRVSSPDFFWGRGDVCIHAKIRSDLILLFCTSGHMHHLHADWAKFLDLRFLPLQIKWCRGSTASSSNWKGWDNLSTYKFTNWRSSKAPWAIFSRLLFPSFLWKKEGQNIILRACRISTSIHQIKKCGIKNTNNLNCYCTHSCVKDTNSENEFSSICFSELCLKFLKNKIAI